jgi:hypothetical protein
MKIAVKNLASLAMPDFCPRCFWIKHNCKNIPFQIFPGVFYAIDSWTKKVVHQYFDRLGAAPDWLPNLQNAVKYHKAPHWSKFTREDPETGIVVSGVVDDRFELEDGTFHIPDYKISKLSKTQDKLFPLYEGQLNIYAWIHEGGFGKVSTIDLIYCEPQTDDFALSSRSVYSADGFRMAFKATVVPVEIKPDLVRGLFDRAKGILDMEEPPYWTDGCKDCLAMGELLKMAAGPGF